MKRRQQLLLDCAKALQNSQMDWCVDRRVANFRFLKANNTFCISTVPLIQNLRFAKCSKQLTVHQRAICGSPRYERPSPAHLAGSAALGKVICYSDGKDLH